jgi:hypothetical protein
MGMPHTVRRYRIGFYRLTDAIFLSCRCNDFAVALGFGMMDIHLTLWDCLLIAVVSPQVALMAYLHHPRWKAFVLSLPLPFSVASLAVGRPVDATNIIGLILLPVERRLWKSNYRVEDDAGDGRQGSLEPNV